MWHFNNMINLLNANMTCISCFLVSRAGDKEPADPGVSGGIRNWIQSVSIAKWEYWCGGGGGEGLKDIELDLEDWKLSKYYQQIWVSVATQIWVHITFLIFHNDSSNEAHNWMGLHSIQKSNSTHVQLYFTQIYLGLKLWKDIFHLHLHLELILSSSGG